MAHLYNVTPELHGIHKKISEAAGVHISVIANALLPQDYSLARDFAQKVDEGVSQTDLLRGLLTHAIFPKAARGSSAAAISPPPPVPREPVAFDWDAPD
ncbi:MAG: hypothetical protein ACK4VI_09160 [Alphaproteobacteria bacterium]